jgi:hypothetical protein
MRFVLPRSVSHKLPGWKVSCLGTQFVSCTANEILYPYMKLLMCLHLWPGSGWPDESLKM